MKAFIAIALIVGSLSAGCFINVTSYTAPDGSTIYVGDFVNDQPGPGYGPAAVEGQLYDSAGNHIGTAGGFTCLGVNPGGVIPFKAWTPAEIPAPARIEWSIIDEPMEPYLATGLTAEVTNTFVAGDETYIVGEVTNTSANTYVATTVCASWTDASGNVVREAWNNGGAWVFDPGVKVPFSVPVHTPPAGAQIHLYLDAFVDIPGYVSGTAVSISSNALKHDFQETEFVDGAYVTTGMGEVHNNTKKHFLADAVANVRNESGRLLATRGVPSQCFATAAPDGFTFMTYEVTAGVATPPEITLEGFQHNDSPIYYPEVSDIEFEENAEAKIITVTGTLTNESDATLYYANVCAGGYDSHGIVRTVGMVNPDLGEDGLAAGASVPFEVIIFDPGNIDDVGVVADAYSE